MANEPKINHVNDGTLFLFIYCLITALFVIAVLITFYLLSKKNQKWKLADNEIGHNDWPLISQKHRRSTALKSPSGVGVVGTHYLKKAPCSTKDLSSPSDCPNLTHVTIVDENDKFKNLEQNQTNLEELSKENNLGNLFFKLKLKKDKNALIITIIKCNKLPFKDSNLIDPYVKLQLLPDKHHKVKTRVLRKTSDPIYDEEFTFYGIEKRFLNDIVLHFIVLSFDRYSRDEIIGEVFVPLHELELSIIDEHQISCNREIMPKNYDSKYHIRGELLVSLCWQPVANRLTVVILKARNLPKMDISGLADPYVKINLYMDNKKLAKKKTHIKKHTLNPVFNESFVYDLPESNDNQPILSRIRLEIIVLDWDRVTKNEVIGRLILGNNSTLNSAVKHWQELYSSPRRQIADWHKLNE